MAKLADGSWYELRLVRASYGELPRDDRWTGNLYYGASLQTLNYFFRTETSKDYEPDVLRIEKRHVQPDRTYHVMGTWNNPATQVPEAKP